MPTSGKCSARVELPSCTLGGLPEGAPSRPSFCLGGAILLDVPVGTKPGRCGLLWALISGRGLRSWGAVFPALAHGGLPADARRRSGAARAYGRWAIQPLVRAWPQGVQQEGRGPAQRYAGFRPGACALLGCCRPRRRGGVGKHCAAGADQALPASVLAGGAAVGADGNGRLPLRRLVRRAAPGAGREAALHRRVFRPAGGAWQPAAGLVGAAGCRLAAVLTGRVPRVVGGWPAPLPPGGTTCPPTQGGSGAQALERGYALGPASTRANPLPPRLRRPPPPGGARRRRRAPIWPTRVLAPARPGATPLQGGVLHDPRSPEPRVVAPPLPGPPRRCGVCTATAGPLSSDRGRPSS
jgi:hypothetical protein